MILQNTYAVKNDKDWFSENIDCSSSVIDVVVAMEKTLSQVKFWIMYDGKIIPNLNT